MEPQLTELLNTDFDGYQFEQLTYNLYSISDTENTTVLKRIGDGWEVWVDGSLCLQGNLDQCIEWIEEYLS